MDHLTKKISSTLKVLRKEHRWSLDITSQKTGVSKAMLGQIERGESSPTIATLWKIASGFNVSFSSFISNLDVTKTVAYRNQYLKQQYLQDDKIKVMPIFPYNEHLKFEVFIIELLPECEHFSLPHQKGVIEHIIVSSGEVEILIDDTWHLIGQNEGVCFNANQTHGYRNTSSTVAAFHNIIHYM